MTRHEWALMLGAWTIALVASLGTRAIIESLTR